MKRLNLIFRVVLTLTVLASLGLVFSPPAAAAAPALQIDVSAWQKNPDTLAITPIAPSACVTPGCDFLINAAVTALTVQCDNVAAVISIQGPAHLADCETPAKSLGNIQACRLTDVWWKLVCDGPGTVTVSVTATALAALRRPEPPP